MSTLADAVSYVAETGGTGPFVFYAGIPSWLTPSQAVTLGEITDGQTVSYAAINDPTNPTQREWGHGTFSAAAGGTIARTTVLGWVDNGAAGSGTPINFSQAPVVAISALAEDIGGGGGGASGWEQLPSPTGATQTTPWVQEVGSNANGTDLFMFAGDADGTGDAGTAWIQLAAGTQDFDPNDAPQTGVLMLDATKQNNFFSIAMPYDSVGNGGQSLEILAGNSVDNGGSLFFHAGSGNGGANMFISAGIGNGGGGGNLTITSGDDNGGNDGGNMNFTAGNSNVAGGAGGGIQFFGGNSVDNNGGGVSFSAGTNLDSTHSGGPFNLQAGSGFTGGGFAAVSGQGLGGGGGLLSFTGGDDFGGGDGAGVQFITGNAFGGSGDGGDVEFTFGTNGGGTGRNGLFFPNLPTADPVVSGAAFTSTTAIPGSTVVLISP